MPSAPKRYVYARLKSEMRVLFAYCSYEGQGIEYLSAVLKKAGHETRLLYDPRLFEDPEGIHRHRTLAKIFDQRRQMLRLVKDFSPDLVAFSVVSADYVWAGRTAGLIKEWNDVPIVFGNIHPTAIPETVIRNDFVDFVILGEGEYALLDLVESLQERKFDYRIPNLYAKRNGDLVANPPRPLIQDLDSLPFPDRDLFRREARHFEIGIMALGRRGCKNACTYCSNSVRGRLYFGDKCQGDTPYLRRRSVDNLITELREAKAKYDFRLVRFNDDDLAESEPWLREFSGKYRREIGVPYKCFINLESISETTVNLLKESNCRDIRIGVQSINPEIRKNVLRRYYSNEQVAQAVGLLRESGIPFLIDHLLGIPGQTEKDLADTVKFYLDHPGGFLNVYWLLYFAGHDIVGIARDQGIITKKYLKELEISPFSGTNIDRDLIHPRRLFKYQNLMWCFNYLPLFLTRFVLRSGIFRFFPSFSLNLYRRIRLFLRSREDCFPHPRDGFELIHLRRRREYLEHVFLKIKRLLYFSWLRREK